MGYLHDYPVDTKRCEEGRGKWRRGASLFFPRPSPMRSFLSINRGCFSCKTKDSNCNCWEFCRRKVSGGLFRSIKYSGNIWYLRRSMRTNPSQCCDIYLKQVLFVFYFILKIRQGHDCQTVRSYDLSSLQALDVIIM